MTTWALIEGGVLKRFTEGARPPDTETQRWLPVERLQPAIDPETEELEGPTLTVFADRVTDVWTRRAKTAAELDGVREAKLAGVFDPVNVALLRALFNVHNRVRVLEGQPQHTAGQFQALVKGLL